MEKYEQPGERLHSKVPTEEYKENYDRIFGKKQYWYEKQLELDFGETKNICPKCGYNWEGVHGYVCYQVDCPTQMKVT